MTRLTRFIVAAFVCLPLGIPTVSAGERSEQAALGPAAENESPSSELISLRDRLRRVLAYHHARPLNSRDHSPWEVMHSIVAYGVQSELVRPGKQGAPVNSVGWLCYGGRCKGQALLQVSQKRIQAVEGPGVQGHPGQFLAILAQSRVDRTYAINLADQTFTIEDLIDSEKLDCRAGTELTFKLIALSHYLDLDETWANKQKQEWSIPRLIQEEIKSPIHGAACGGTHRLMGLSYAFRVREARGEPLDGEYARAAKYVRDYHLYTFGLQNTDGSFSTEWFKRKGARQDLDRRLQTTGHILEWLVYSIPDEQLRDSRVVRAVTYLVDILEKNPSRNWSIGPLGHGLHALVIYDERMFKPWDSSPVSPVSPEPLADADPELLPVPSAQANSEAPTHQAAKQSLKSPPRVTLRLAQPKSAPSVTKARSPATPIPKSARAPAVKARRQTPKKITNPNATSEPARDATAVEDADVTAPAEDATGDAHTHATDDSSSSDAATDDEQNSPPDAATVGTTSSQQPADQDEPAESSADVEAAPQEAETTSAPDEVQGPALGTP